MHAHFSRIHTYTLFNLFQRPSMGVRFPIQLLPVLYLVDLYKSLCWKNQMNPKQGMLTRGKQIQKICIATL